MKIKRTLKIAIGLLGCKKEAAIMPSSVDQNASTSTTPRKTGNKAVTITACQPAAVGIPPTPVIPFPMPI